MDNLEKINLDKLNNDRVIKTRMAVAKAIRVLTREKLMLHYKNYSDFKLENVAAVVNFLESAIEEMTFACEHFSWDIGVTLQLDDAIVELGKVMAASYKDDYDIAESENEFVLTDALVMLSKALATLVNWFDKDVRDPEETEC